MIEGLKPYAEYKDSGLPWTGAIPAHWNVNQAGQIGRLLKGSGGSKADNVDEGLPCVRYGQLYTKYRGFIQAPKSFISPTKAAQYTSIRYGDILFAASGEKVDEIGKSAVNLMRCAAFCGGDVIILRPKIDAFPAFFGYVFDSYASASQKATMCRGTTIKHIYPDELRQLAISLPPLDEQAAIVRFLDHANRKIDRFIRVKRKLIVLLNEQKQAIIQTAISKVSTPDCTTMPVRAVLRPVKRMGHPNKTLLSLFRDYGVIPKDSRENKNVDVRDLALCQLVKPGDVVMNKMKAWQGSIAVSGLEGIVSPDYMVLEFQIKTIVEDFFHYALRSPIMVANYRKQAYGVRPGQWRLMYPDFCRLRLPVPSIEVQQSIVGHIKSETAALTTAITRTEREIALMQEYRTRLTSDIVTGKLDVRAVAAGLPELGDDAGSEPDVPVAFDDLEAEETDA